ncbi:MAG TPA: chorismate mutase [Dongiaceae bacterium]|nr:chorismate mutase [Dongiaceae bacterium]
MTDDIQTLRRDIDAADRQILALVNRRMELALEIGRRKKGTVQQIAHFYRPAREMAIIRELDGINQGPLPRLALVRLWRQIIAAGLQLQCPFRITYVTGKGLGELAENHFGATTPLIAHRSEMQALNALTSGAAELALLPIPGPELKQAWWPSLRAPFYILGRLPAVIDARNGSNGRTPDLFGRRTAGLEGLIVGQAGFEASGIDKTLFALRLSQERSRAALLAEITQAGFAAELWDARFSEGVHHYLFAVDGYIEPQDARLEGISTEWSWLGAIAAQIAA